MYHLKFMTNEIAWCIHSCVCVCVWVSGCLLSSRDFQNELRYVNITPETKLFPVSFTAFTSIFSKDTAALPADRQLVTEHHK